MKFDYTLALIVWMFQAVILGILASAIKNRSALFWTVVGLVLPGLGFLLLCACRKAPRDSTLYEMTFYGTVPSERSDLGKKGWKL